jgi:hypothetical protein
MITLEQERPVDDIHLTGLAVSERQGRGCLFTALLAVQTYQNPELADIDPETYLDGIEEMYPGVTVNKKVHFSHFFDVLELAKKQGVHASKITMREQASPRLLHSYASAYERTYADSSENERPGFAVVPDEEFSTDKAVAPFTVLLHEEGRRDSHAITYDQSPEATQMIAEYIESGFSVTGIIEYFSKG